MAWSALKALLLVYGSAKTKNWTKKMNKTLAGEMVYFE